MSLSNVISQSLPTLHRRITHNAVAHQRDLAELAHTWQENRTQCSCTCASHQGALPVSAHTSQDNHTRALPPLEGAADLFWPAQLLPVRMITIPTAMTSLGQTHISTTQDGEKLNNLLPLGASWLTIRRFCWRRCPSAIWGEYLWRRPRFYGKISTGSDSYVLTIWRGTPAKYDVENFAFNFGFSWQDLHKKWKPCTNGMPQDSTVETNLDVFSERFQCDAWGGIGPLSMPLKPPARRSTL